MSKKGNPAVIGAFVLGAIGLLVAGVMFFGSGKFFKETSNFVLFFEGSVKGLSIGSPVRLKGVQIGEVTDIKVAFNLKDMTFHTPVYIEVDGERIAGVSEGGISERVQQDTEKSKPGEGIRRLVDAGLRGKMEMQSFVTGQLAIALDMHPDSPLNYVGLDKRYQEIPTLPTDLQKLAKTLEEIPFDQMVQDVRQTLSGIRNLVNSKKLNDAIDSLYVALGSLDEVVKDFGKLTRNLDSRVGPVTSSIEDAMRDAQKLVQNVDGRIGPLASELKEVTDAAESALKQAEQALAVIQEMAGRSSPVYATIDETLKEVARAARSLRVLADYLEQNPDALIFGKGKGGGE